MMLHEKLQEIETDGLHPSDHARELLEIWDRGDYEEFLSEVATRPVPGPALLFLLNMVANDAAYAVDRRHLMRGRLDDEHRQGMHGDRSRKGGLVPKNPHKELALRLFDIARPKAPSDSAACEEVVAQIKKDKAKSPAFGTVTRWVRERKGE
jgi:hypothetical protein